MRQRIQNSMILIITLTLLISYLITTLAVYRQTLSTVKDEIGQEADYIRAATQISGASYLQEIDIVQTSTLITLLTPDGDVLYDSLDKSLDHIDINAYPEIGSALRAGKGETLRSNGFFRGRMFYYALKMNNGNILWVHKSLSSAIQMSLQILPVMLLMAFLLTIVAWLLSKWQASRLIKPVNALNLENPLENDVYEELHPLLVRIDRQNKEKDAIAEMRKEFSANVSHELRTPLTSISGYAEIMKEGLVDPENTRIFSDHIYAEAQQLIRLIEDTIRLSRLDEQQITEEKETIDLFPLTQDIVSRLTPYAGQKEVSLTLSGKPSPCLGIRPVLEDMIYNLCENAIKYNHAGGSVRVLTGQKENAPFVRVSDTGIGIAPEEQERIFERFYRVEKSHSSKTGGSGLGLSIVKHGAHMHGAVINMESTLGAGTTVELVFPPAFPEPS